MSRDPVEPLNPYAPPKSTSGVEPRAEAPRLEGPDGPYKDQSSVVAILRVLLALMGLNEGVAAVVCLALNQETIDGETSDALVRTSAILVGVTSLLFLVIAIPFGRFLVQANRNARVLGGTPLGFTPGSMVWWFVVPFANWVRPYQAVRAVWDASAPRRDGARPVGTSSVLTPWWAAWLLDTLGSRMITGLGSSSDPAERNFLLAGSHLAGVALCFFAERLVRLLHERQVARAEEVAHGIGEDDGDDDARLRVSRKKRRQSRTRRASREPTE
ncbi:MAG TPA: DUF4328 domain-containing protein [Polyangiaceae bacterium]|nr:DUF4328 domain-containing protein [Polyangiaceae bacterium]